ncbi:MAG: alpha/beta hydrolase [Actinobacteria bacterium]|nr:alpha/beta hydrolase [Actinomycetota bacterium]
MKQQQDCIALRAPLAPDCDELRLELLAAQGSGPVSTDPIEVQTQHRSQAPIRRSKWRPDPDTIPVTSVDEVIAGVPVRRYAPLGSPAPSTTLMWLHGGGWVFGDIDTADPVARTACDRTGWGVVSVDYRLAPQHPFPAGIDDSIAVTAALLDLGHRVVVGGDSAGGNLAAVVARHFAGHEGVVGQVLIYPCIDPSLSTPSALEFIDGPFITRAGLEWCYGHYLAGASAEDPRVDLTGSVPAKLPPAVVLTVGHDPLRDEGIAYANALIDAGVTTRHFHAADSFHGSFGLSGSLPSAAEEVERIWATAVSLMD